MIDIIDIAYVQSRGNILIISDDNNNYHIGDILPIYNKLNLTITFVHIKGIEMAKDLLFGNIKMPIGLNIQEYIDVNYNNLSIISMDELKKYIEEERIYLKPKNEMIYLNCHFKIFEVLKILFIDIPNYTTVQYKDSNLTVDLFDNYFDYILIRK